MVAGVGFLIAVAIGVTGVGGGILTAPILIVFMGVPPAEAVTVALLFAAAVKLLIAPAYVWRGQVNFRVLWKLLLGGIPGVAAGSVAMKGLSSMRQSGALGVVLGSTIVVVAAFNLYRLRSGAATATGSRDRSRWLPLVAFPIGAEVGFSSAGAGALGTLALMGMTPLTASQVVATDVCFGLGLSLVGGGLHLSFARVTPALLWPLLAGGLAGGVTGVMIAGMLPARPLRAALCVWLMALGVQLCWKSIGL